MATGSFVYWYGRRHIWSRPSEFIVPVLRWLWWEACKACYQNASPTPGKHELLMQISAMHKSKGQECVWLQPHLGALSGSWISSAIGPPLLRHFHRRDLGEPAALSALESVLLKCSAEAIGFLSSAGGLAFHVSIIKKMNLAHQWARARRQNYSSNNRFPGLK